MFDVPMRSDLSAVPVPLPGRVIIFVDGDGALRARLPDGSVAALEAGPKGDPGVTDWAGISGKPVIRERLSAPLTLYVSPSGDDLASGLTVAEPMRTIAKAAAIVGGLDVGAYAVTIQLADGDHVAGLSLPGYVSTGGGAVIRGNTADMSAVRLLGAGTKVLSLSVPSRWTVNACRVGWGSGDALSVSGGGAYLLGANLTFEPSVGAGYCLAASGVGRGHLTNTKINAGCAGVVYASGGRVDLGGTMTAVNAPAFATAFASVANMSLLMADSLTVVGQAVGVRYWVTSGSVINAGGRGDQYLLGDAHGGAMSGGVYL